MIDIMATGQCPEDPGFPESPRLSFSLELPQATRSPATQGLQHSLPLAATPSDFGFCTEWETSSQGLSHADELFSDGMIQPLAFNLRSSIASPSAPPSQPGDLQKEPILREMTDDEDGNAGVKRSGSQRLFWPFSRSSKSTAGFVCLFPLPRSKSTTSLPSPSPSQWHNTTMSNELHQRLICRLPLIRGKSVSSPPNPIPKQGQDKKKNISINSPLLLRDQVSRDPNEETGSGTEIKSKGNTNSKKSRGGGNHFVRKACKDSKRNAYYYAGSRRESCESGVRISPILNVPETYMNGCSSYLLCGSKPLD